MRFEGKRAALHTLGCKVNEYETDAMRASLEEAGFSIVDFRQTADVYVINTCSVTNIADRKSRQMIGRARKLNPDAVVVAAGCYVQTALEKTGKTVDADILIGSGRKSALVEELERYFSSEETRAKASAETAAKVSAETRAKASAETAAKVSAETRAKASAETAAKEPEETSGSSSQPCAAEESGRNACSREPARVRGDGEQENGIRRKPLSRVSDVMREKEYDALSLPGIAGHTRAWIKVQDGCSMFCSYCIIPFARGRIRSRRTDDVLEELRGLAQQGVREVVLTGIHLSSYGVDFDTQDVIDQVYGERGGRRAWQDRSRLIDLIEEVCRIDGIGRVRLGSLEPTIVTEQFAERLRSAGKVCPHFHLSLQSGCDSVLQRMNRHYTTREYLHSLELLRGAFDRPAITTDVIVGFPGESEEEFEQTRSFLEQAHFYETHLFRYSMRAGTKAARMEGQIPESIKEERLARLAALDLEMRERFERSWQGSEVEVLFEEAAQIDKDGSICVPNSGRPSESLSRLRPGQGEKLYTGYTREYMRVYALSRQDLRGQILTGRLQGLLVSL